MTTSIASTAPVPMDPREQISSSVFESMVQSGQLKDNGLHLEGHLGPYTLRSGFQPIYSPAHMRPVGFEALLRAQRDHQPVSPGEVFSNFSSHQDTLSLDRLCRALHMGNFRRTAPPSVWMFLNINPHVMLDGKRQGVFFTPEVARRYRLPNHRVVVEILEKAIKDEGLLAEAVAHYRELGFLVAVDDFGAGESNFDRIWRLQPDIVKLDRSMVVNAATNPVARRILPSLVRLIHEAGCLALVEGIETEEQARITLNADVDFLQGFYFSRPIIGADRLCGDQISMLGKLASRQRKDTGEKMRRYAKALKTFIHQFNQAAGAYAAGLSLESACETMLEQNRVLRMFLLNEQGQQTGRNLTGRHASDRMPMRFQPLADANHADWSRRPYYRRAIHHPGEVQITGPYFSLPDAESCVTLSRTVTPLDGRTRVLCCDLRWKGGTDMISGSVGAWGR